MSQTQSIKKHLEQGKTITQMEALVLYGIFRLASRISDCKRLGLDIKTEIVHRNKKKWARYSME